ncbi:hypothetical protein [Roseateles chitinivorans]|uniref:hypothetical protein n=1 Tax=Roseateles chitinivorans TaxID=2917965 RepID=UPI003D67C291
MLRTLCGIEPLWKLSTNGPEALSRIIVGRLEALRRLLGELQSSTGGFRLTGPSHRANP